MVVATIEDLAFAHCSSKDPDGVRRRGCIEHSSEKEVELGLNRGHHFIGSQTDRRSSAAAEKGGEGMALQI
jgi:hypothetical protein